METTSSGKEGRTSKYKLHNSMPIEVDDDTTTTQPRQRVVSFRVAFVPPVVPPGRLVWPGITFVRRACNDRRSCRTRTLMVHSRCRACNNIVKW